MNHLFCGESAEQSFSRFNHSSPALIFREALATGPAALPSENWYHLRAQYLSDALDANYATCLEEWKQFGAALDAQASEELACWFGNDFFCQVAFIYALVHLGKNPNRELFFVSPGSVDDGMYCFGDVPAAEMNDRLQKRSPIRPLDLQQAAIAWHLYAEPDPRCLNAVFDGSIDIGPRFAGVLEQHANRFPSTVDNLGITERTILHALRSGPLPFTDLFQDVSRKTREYGWSDLQTRNVCWRMVTSEPALVELIYPEETPSNRSQNTLPLARLKLTETAHTIQEGERIDVSSMGYWLGGCEMTQDCGWHWDPRARRIEGNRMS